MQHARDDARRSARTDREMTNDVRVNRSVTIPGREIELSFSPSGGPGGQHANRSSTRVEAVWDIAASQALGPRQRERILRRLRNRIDSSGRLRLSSDAHRSQSRNRDEVLDRLARLVDDALKVRPKRVPTAPTPQSKERRLQHKKRRSATKRLRRPYLDE